MEFQISVHGSKVVRRVGAVRVCVRWLWLRNSLLSLRTPLSSHGWLVTRFSAAENVEAKTVMGQYLMTALNWRFIGQ